MEQPNILLITSDQQRYDTISPHAPSFLRTPHIDRLAHEGIRFDRAYADWRGLTPLFYPHINPYGRFDLDMFYRIPLAS